MSPASWIRFSNSGFASGLMSSPMIVNSERLASSSSNCPDPQPMSMQIPLRIPPKSRISRMAVMGYVCLTRFWEIQSWTSAEFLPGPMR